MQDNKTAWDGKNNNGELVGSDTYFTVLQAGDFVDKKKILVK
jgi:hypothetical protein